MANEDLFEVRKDKRDLFIDDTILAKLPEEKRNSAKDISIKIINDYVGQDLNALSVLAYAAKDGRFDEFVEKLETHYQKILKYVHPEARKLANVPGAVRTENFFLECYKSLGIKPN
jgi:hypothetical protein